MGAITSFANKKNSTSVFPNISKQDFVNDLTNIINNPEIIDQGNTGTCGAAVLSKIFATASPLDYVNAAISLYETGTATLNSMTLTAPDFLRQEGSIELSAVNTVMMGTLTNDANKGLDYNPNTDGSGLKSFMWPSYIGKFAQDFMGKTVQMLEPGRTTNDYQAFMNADFKNSYIVGEVNTKVLFGNQAGAAFADHYLQVTGIQSLGNSVGSGYKMDYWSWGATSQNVSVSDQQFRGIMAIFIIK